MIELFASGKPPNCFDGTDHHVFGTVIPCDLLTSNSEPSSLLPNKANVHIADALSFVASGMWIISFLIAKMERLNYAICKFFAEVVM